MSKIPVFDSGQFHRSGPDDTPCAPLSGLGLAEHPPMIRVQYDKPGEPVNFYRVAQCVEGRPLGYVYKSAGRDARTIIIGSC